MKKFRYKILRDGNGSFYGRYKWGRQWRWKYLKLESHWSARHPDRTRFVSWSTAEVALKERHEILVQDELATHLQVVRTGEL